MASILAVHPVLNVRDLSASMVWYEQLGFERRFADDGPNPMYGGVARDAVEIHLQWHSSDEWKDGLDGNAYRFFVDDPDALHEEIATGTTVLDGRSVTNTAWGTREFGLYDPDGNALFFYRDLSAGERGFSE